MKRSNAESRVTDQGSKSLKHCGGIAQSSPQGSLSTMKDDTKVKNTTSRYTATGNIHDTTNHNERLRMVINHNKCQTTQVTITDYTITRKSDERGNKFIQVNEDLTSLVIKNTLKRIKMVINYDQQ